MATLNVNEIEDFSELGQDFLFKTKDKIYCIPAIPPFVAKKLLKIARDFSKASEVREAQIKAFQEENEKLPLEEQKPIPSNLLEEIGDFYDFQMEFICIANPVEINSDGHKISDITKEDIEGIEGVKKRMAYSSCNESI